MKQIVATKNERYLVIKFNEWKKSVLVEESEMYFKLELLGAESPITFTCEIIDNQKADLVIYMSTEHKEPGEKKHQRMVERMKRFKFAAKKKAAFFGMDDVCYLMMKSSVGCTLKITVQSNKIQALAEPEKLKEFNAAKTKAEIQADEYAAKKKEMYI